MCQIASQASLKSLREEHEKLQAQLFDMSSKIELDAGSRQREVSTGHEPPYAAPQHSTHCLAQDTFGLLGISAHMLSLAHMFSLHTCFHWRECVRACRCV